MLELERSELFLATKWVVFPSEFVQFQLLLHTIELLLKLELVQLLLRLVQLLRAWLCCNTGAICFLLPQLVELPLRLVQLLRGWLGCETGATGFLLPKLVELPLCLMQFQGALEMLKLFALGEFVDLFLLGRVRPLLSERVGRCPAGSRSQKKR